ncbi:hypothetical protein MSM1_16575 [Mycobacterium sp. SM1]|uniref:hypothetical protein n=1 Tax=Mycobacterium sp. SM1 TaxID=2816243 RepID=UPI001BD07C49|nr:hypothetical protein [Mycobacterium sp. SM1]MBS4729890.1 hypothetical protein [Mycobacterium sp. SM1]
MSYDINFWLPKPGQTFDEWAESFEGTYGPQEQHLLAAALQQVRTQAESVLPEAEIREEAGGVAFDDDATGISFGYTPTGVSLSCPYRCGTGSTRIPLMYDIAATVASLTGLQAYLDFSSNVELRGVANVKGALPQG